MTFLVSPGVNVTEFDLTTIIPEVAVSSGALAGVFQWGPVNERVLVDSEVNLVKRFYTPSNFNPETWFSGANFLGYGNSLYVSRAGDITGNTNTVAAGNAIVNALSTGSNVVKFTTTTGLNLHFGQVLFLTNSAQAVFGSINPTITNITGNTVVLSSSALANVGNVAITFRDDILFSAVAQEIPDGTINWANQLVANTSDYTNRDGLFAPSVQWVARYPGVPGNSLRVSVCDSYTQFRSTLTAFNGNTAQTNATTSAISATVGSPTLTFTVVNTDSANITTLAAATVLQANTLRQSIAVNDLLGAGNTRIGFQFLKTVSVGPVTYTNTVSSFTSAQFTVTTDEAYNLGANIAQPDIERYWEFYNLVDVPPDQSTYVLNFGNTSANDELHVVVVDEDGSFSGIPDTVLEVYKNVSRATDGKSEDGRTNFYKHVINQGSQYIWYANDRSTAVSNTAQYVTSSTAAAAYSVSLYGGGNGPNEDNIDVGHLTFAYDQFASAEDVDIGLVIQGKARGEPISHYTTLAEYLIENLAEKRKDCVVFVSPDIDDVVNNTGNETDDVVDFRNVITSSSYGVLDSGYKYQYDRYNNIYRWIPLNGDIAGLCTRTDYTNDPWWSPAGFNRGQIKNVVRLSWNPRQSFRDALYKSGVNPVVTFPGQGTILFGDKTLLAKPSAFDRINVRRLFIVLEKAIATASKFLLFEFNDDFTRATFKNMVIPYLRDVQGRRGIQDFLVVCDSTNNTPTVIDRNEFIGDIYIKPARSINFIQLNFIAVPTGVAFQEVVGKFGQI